jgi:hypothetical protein
MAAKGVSTGAGIYGGMKGFQALERAVQSKSSLKQIEENKKKMLEHPEFKDYPEKVEARFQEIAQVAPNVAAHAPLLERIMKKSLHSGLSDADAEKLSILQFQAAPKTKLQSKTASMRPEVVGMLLADIVQLTKVADAPPEHFMMPFLKAIGVMTGGALVAGAVGGGISALKSTIDAHDMKNKLDASFKSAVKLSDPDKEPLHSDMERAREAFKVLAHFAPHVALQPQAARTFMNNMISFSGTAGTRDFPVQVPQLKDLTEIEKNIGHSSKPGFMEGFTGTLDATGLGGTIGKTTELAGKAISGARF